MVLKRPTLFLSALLTVPLMAQGTPDAFLAQLPSPPDPCGASLEARRDFFQKVDDALKAMDALQQRQAQANKAAAKAAEERLKAQYKQALGGAAGDSGQGRKMSPEEKKAMAAKVLKEQAGMTMEDVQKLQAMSPEERRAWAMGRPLPPAAAKGKDAAGKAPSLGNLPGNGLSADERKEMQTLQSDIAARSARIGQRYDQVMKGFGATPRPAPQRGFTPAGQADPACRTFAGQYKTILVDHMTATRQTIQDSARLEKLMAKQYGMASLPGAGEGGLGQVQEYARALRDIFQFDR